MADFSPIGPTDICNLALFELGVQPISDIDDANNNNAVLCSKAFWSAVREAARAHNWKCLQKRQSLNQLPAASVANSTTAIGWPGDQVTTPPPYWAANTAYAGGTLITYGEAVYYCLMSYTSSANFINDLTAGYWAQLYQSFFAANCGFGGPFGWSFGYALPTDYLLISELNGNSCARGWGIGSLYDIMVLQTVAADKSVSNQLCLFTNNSCANVKYTAFIQDTTIFDALLVEAISVLLASKISTTVRGDDGIMARALRAKFTMDVLPRAQVKDANETKPRRYDPTRESDFLRSRYGSTNG